MPPQQLAGHNFAQVRFMKHGRRMLGRFLSKELPAEDLAAEQAHSDIIVTFTTPSRGQSNRQIGCPIVFGQREQTKGEILSFSFGLYSLLIFTSMLS